jgi:hypothetical protein
LTAGTASPTLPGERHGTSTACDAAQVVCRVITWSPDRMKAAARLLLVVLLVAGCGAGHMTGDIKTDTPDGDYAGYTGGTAVWSGTNGLAVIGDGRVTLKGGEALGLAADIPVTWSLNLLEQSTTGIGIFPQDQVPPEVTAAAKPLEGAVVTKGDGTFQIIAQFTSPQGEVAIHGYRLRYEVNGTEHTVFIPHSDHICPGNLDGCAFIPPTP